MCARCDDLRSPIKREEALAVADCVGTHFYHFECIEANIAVRGRECIVCPSTPPAPPTASTGGQPEGVEQDLHLPHEEPHLGMGSTFSGTESVSSNYYVYPGRLRKAFEKYSSESGKFGSAPGREYRPGLVA